MTFLVIGGVGLVLLLLSFVLDEALGEVFSFLDSDFLSGTAIGGFLTMFGFSGSLLERFGLPAAIGGGAVAGLATAAAVTWATRALMRSSDPGAVKTADLVGREATVITPVPLDGLGQVSIVVDGHLIRLSARRAPDQPVGGALPAPSAYGPAAGYGPAGSAELQAGTTVRVTAVLSATSVEVTAAS